MTTGNLDTASTNVTAAATKVGNEIARHISSPNSSPLTSSPLTSA